MREKVLREILRPLTNNFGETLTKKIIEEFNSIPREKKRGKSNITILAAITYRVLNENDIPTLISEVPKWFNLNVLNLDPAQILYYLEHRKVNRAYLRLYKDKEEIRVNIKKLIQKYAKGDRGKEALDFYKENKHVLDRHAPQVAAAVCLYKASYFKSLRSAARCFSTAPNSISNVLRELRDENVF